MIRRWPILLFVSSITIFSLHYAFGFAEDKTPSQTMKGPPAPAGWPPAATQPAATKPVDIPQAHTHSPAETIAMTRLQPGYHLELIASEPEIISPVCLAWDGDGRMYVAEMASYMLDIDAKNEKDPISRIVRFEDTKGDGHYDKHTTFVDKLVLPRMILPLDDRILVRCTDSKDIYAYRDTKGTGVADEKVKAFDGAGEVQRNFNLEHQASGLLWDLDNWIYITHDGERYRYKDGKLISQKIPNTVGQWGIAMDDWGKLIFSTGGNENPAHDFQFMPQYGTFDFKDQWGPHFMEVFPILPFTDVQGGFRRVKEGGGLSHFTGCGGPSIYRGDTLPKDLEGDYILPEPVGRLVRRAKVTYEDGKTVISNAYQNQEFIASLDANFRPVWSATGPDGCIYFCDMSHGIIQEHEWTKEGSFLRPQIKKYGLDKNNHAGRIYRLVYDGMKRREEKPHMLEEAPAQLVEHLKDPNGWWRDTAQKLLIIRGDKSVVPALLEMARSAENPITRLHAFWTLDGLNAADAQLIKEKLKDSDRHVRQAAVRMAEPMMTKNDSDMMSALAAMAVDPDQDVAAQYCLSLIYSKNPRADELVKEALASRANQKIKDEIVKTTVTMKYEALTKAKNEAAKQKRLAKRDPRVAKLMENGKMLYSQTCITCHGVDGQGQPTPEQTGMLAPPLAGSVRLRGDKDIVCRLVLRGLTGPHDYGKTYPNEMAGFAFADDDFVASVLTYARGTWGNRASAVFPADVAKARKETEKRDKPYVLKEIEEMKKEKEK